MTLDRLHLHPKMICVLVAAVVCAGCGGVVSTREELVAFTQAGAQSKANVAKLAQAIQTAGPYKVGPGDVLVVQMGEAVHPAIDAAATQVDQRNIERCRVDGAGRIVLPIVGPMNVKGKTLAEVERQIVAAYCPKYVTHAPNALVKIEEYETGSVTVMGAVAKPGAYDMRRDEMTLINALVKAGGIIGGGNLQCVRIRGAADGSERKIVMPVKEGVTTFEDAPLKKGDVVQVEATDAQYFLVFGLVKKPGAYPYPAGQEYNLAQAIGFAGGLDDTAPDFIQVYRKDAEGKIRGVKVTLSGNGPTSAINVPIRPGDIVAVDHTSGSKTRNIFSKILHGDLGVTANYNFFK